MAGNDRISGPAISVGSGHFEPCRPRILCEDVHLRGLQFHIKFINIPGPYIHVDSHTTTRIPSIVALSLILI